MIKIEINNSKKYSVNNQLILNTVKFAEKLEKTINGIVEINLVNNQEIKQINKLWRQKNSITDVLSFAWREEKKLKSDYLGQIFISYPRIIKQAKEYKVNSEEEFVRMLAHGLLHLVGYDHKTTKDAKKMFFVQEKILSKQFKKK
ncbi:MAG: rRNA maturation RNase YbeY [Candidatus Magasanikbacteria bacterium CG10_big_fil_rev_8_21_14_0_10_36_32]|uniref:Endoribonuclease YbeY n=1 Tax=Candidatus Magasanikbacteria bacterium CG10_big_fil_rev_8_21_14_0_10_36_32 TaxID=1974646 RepID=A0A2M6W5N9_9BACT|nr:MAG: rRNA maturation RNase YbeY [Candidatus Magasanikbacteria bacterium CG10_big_fil_rev_8_21_14_0_10_36_32]